MEKLCDGYYALLYEELERYEDILSQLDRDYEREKREQFIIAIDFSELHDYIHASSKDAGRAIINKYVIDNSVERFTLLPGSFYELLKDINSITGGTNRQGYDMLKRNFEKVYKFFNDFPKAIRSYDEAIKLYNDSYGQAEDEVGQAIIFLLNIYAPQFNVIQQLQNLLLGNKLAPISGIDRLNDIEPALKDRCRNIYNEIESNLNIRRSEKNINNQIDAADSILALMLNEHVNKSSRYITIYSQSAHFVRVLSQKYFKWDNDFLVRNADYLKFRTNLQNMYDTLDKRHGFVQNWIRDLRFMKNKINSLANIHNTLKAPENSEQSVQLVELYRRFIEECRDPLNHVDNAIDHDMQENTIKNIYKSMTQFSSYDGGVEQTLDVLKEHLRSIFKEIGDLDPSQTDSKRIGDYINRIKKWLDNDK